MLYVCAPRVRRVRQVRQGDGRPLLRLLGVPGLGGMETMIAETMLADLRARAARVCWCKCTGCFTQKASMGPNGQIRRLSSRPAGASRRCRGSGGGSGHPGRPHP